MTVTTMTLPKAEPQTALRVQTRRLAGLVLAAALLLVAAPASAGDPARGQQIFAKCRSCHAIIAPDGTAVLKGGRTGPNLYGLIGRKVGGDPDYTYSAAFNTLRDTGRVWDAASLSDYLMNPSRWLQDTLGDPTARSKMVLQLGSGGEDIAAFLQSAQD